MWPISDLTHVRNDYVFPGQNVVFSKGFWHMSENVCFPTFSDTSAIGWSLIHRIFRSAKTTCFVVVPEHARRHQQSMAGWLDPSVLLPKSTLSDMWRRHQKSIVLHVFSTTFWHVADQWSATCHQTLCFPTCFDTSAIRWSTWSWDVLHLLCFPLLFDMWQISDLPHVTKRYVFQHYLTPQPSGDPPDLEMCSICFL